MKIYCLPFQAQLPLTGNGNIFEYESLDTTRCGQFEILYEKRKEQPKPYSTGCSFHSYQNKTIPTDSAENSGPYVVSSTLHGLYFT